MLKICNWFKVHELSALMNKLSSSSKRQFQRQSECKESQPATLNLRLLLMLLAIQEARVNAIHFVTGSCKCSSATSLISYLIHMIVLQTLVSVQNDPPKYLLCGINCSNTTVKRNQGRQWKREREREVRGKNIILSDWIPYGRTRWHWGDYQKFSRKKMHFNGRQKSIFLL